MSKPVSCRRSLPHVLRRAAGVILVVLAVWDWSGLASSVWAQPSRPLLHHAPPSPRLEHLVEGLGLDEETLAHVDAIIDASRAKKRTLRRQLRDAHAQMHGLLEEEEPQETVLLEQVDVISHLRAALRKEQLKTMLRVRALLSPEQRAKLLERLHKGPRRGRRGPGWERGFPPSPPPHAAQ